MSGGLAEGEPLTSDRSAFCKGSRESKVNDRRQSWGLGGPRGAMPGHRPGLGLWTLQALLRKRRPGS